MTLYFAQIDSERLAYFREAWQKILDRSRQEIEAFIQADLALAAQEGTLEAVARLYAADCARWLNDRDVQP